MDLHDLVNAIVAGDLLSARQCVADAERENLRWEHLEAPHGLDDLRLAIAAGVVELLASRRGVSPPSWTATVD
jgi:hypothetical protein